MGKWLGVGLVLTSAVCFGMMPIFAHPAYADGADVPTLMFQRFGIASVLFWIVILLKKEPLPTGKSMRLLALMGLVYFGQAFAFFEALRFLPAGLTSLLAFLYPVFVTVGAHFLFKEHIGLRTLGALTVALVGMALSLGPIGHASVPGIYLAILAAIGMSVYMLLGAKALEGTSPLASTAVVTGAAAIGALCMALFNGFTPVRFIELEWGLALSLASFCGIATVLMGIRMIGSVSTSVIGVIEPITTAVLASVFLGQMLHGLQIAGGVLIVAGVVLLVLVKRRKVEVLELGL